jgi:hypothetical protein
MENVAILGQARHNAQQIKCGATNHYRVEQKPSLGQVLSNASKIVFVSCMVSL